MLFCFYHPRYVLVRFRTQTTNTPLINSVSLYITIIAKSGSLVKVGVQLRSISICDWLRFGGVVRAVTVTSSLCVTASCFESAFSEFMLLCLHW